MSRRRGWSDITVTDQFCGAGGSSIGASKAGLRIRMAMNHWKLAVETHNTNFPNTDHDCCDVSAADPRRYPSTDILITSPECTTHSPAGGNREQRKDYGQRDIFMPTAEDPAAERSRATMRDVPRFAEYHRYRRIIVENVVEATKWGPNKDGSLFVHWLKEMEIIGYRWKLVSANSMFSWPTPQSRDRLYVVMWLKGDKAPDMEVCPPGHCHRCERVVNAVQTWKPKALARALNGQPFGKYRTQYFYACPDCRGEVVPFYYAAINAIDFSIPAIRIGDRLDLGMPALKARTIDRIDYGLEKYGNRHLIVNVKQGERDSSRAWPAHLRPIGSIPTWDDYFGLASPFIVRAANPGPATGRRASGLDESLTTVHAGGNAHALVQPGFLFNVAGRDADAALSAAMPTQETREKFALCFLAALRGTDHSQRSSWAIAMDEPIGTISAGGIHHALIGSAFLSSQYSGSFQASGMDEAAPTMATHDKHALVIPGAAQISLRDADAMHVAGLDVELMTQGCTPQQGLVSRTPFILSQHEGRATGVDSPIPTVPAIPGHYIAQPGKKLKAEDCHFRMLQPHEIGAAMAFPGDYSVLGNKRERVKQYGNAVTPPVMKMLIERTVQSLTGDRAA